MIVPTALVALLTYTPPGNGVVLSVAFRSAKERPLRHLREEREIYW
ncbi:hypothetical protein [Roseimaritima multifibrata]|nr:hypothetical protein [Roseimaritima multifibrata]